MALAFVPFESAIERIIEGAFDFGSDTIKIAISNTAPTASSDALLADITEISAGNGYTAGGGTVSISAAAQTGGTYSVTCDADVVWIASGGDIGPGRYFILYDDTLAGDPLIAYWDYGSSITITDGNHLHLYLDGVTLLSGTLS